MICDQTSHHVNSLVNVWSSYRTDGLPHDIHAMLSLRITDVQHDLTYNQKGLWLFAPRTARHDVEIHQFCCATGA